MKKIDGEPNPYRAGFLQFARFPETEEDAYKLYKEPAEFIYGRCLHVDSHFGAPPGYTTEATIRSGITRQVGQAAQQESD